MRKSLLFLVLLVALPMMAQTTSFDQFKQQQNAKWDKFKTDKQEEFDAFRKQVNEQYAEFMRRKWEVFPVQEEEKLL